jgi:Flp pilus assembly protein TadB
MQKTKATSTTRRRDVTVPEVGTTTLLRARTRRRQNMEEEEDGGSSSAAADTNDRVDDINDNYENNESTINQIKDENSLASFVIVILDAQWFAWLIVVIVIVFVCCCDLLLSLYIFLFSWD